MTRTACRQLGRDDDDVVPPPARPVGRATDRAPEGAESPRRAPDVTGLGAVLLSGRTPSQRLASPVRRRQRTGGTP
jgi:hypothetical protein